MTPSRQPPGAPAANRFERHPYLTAAVICGLLLLAFFFAAEWMLAPGAAPAARPGATASLYQHRGLDVREWQPNRSRRFGTPPERRNGSAEPVRDWYALDIDSLGFIEPSFVHARPDVEIAFLGGSTTECLYILPGERFPYLAGRLLEERSGLKVNAINAGRSGNTAMHSLVVYLAKIAPLRPRYVLLLNATNDIGVLGQGGSYWEAGGGFRLLRERDRSLGRLIEDIRAATFPYTLERLGEGWRAFKARVSSWFSASAQGDAMQQEDAALRRRKAFRTQYEAALRSFVQLARNWGSTPVLMTQVLVRPDSDGGFAGTLSPEQLARGDFDEAGFSDMHAYANSIIRHVAISEGAMLIDLAAARQWRNREDVYDGLHFTSAGSRKVAEIIAGALARDIESRPSN